jgi:hypothetical protein
MESVRRDDADKGYIWIVVAPTIICVPQNISLRFRASLKSVMGVFRDIVSRSILQHPGRGCISVLSVSRPHSPGRYPGSWDNLPGLDLIVDNGTGGTILK